MIFAGGMEATMTEMTIVGFSNMTALTKNPDPNTASRPFDKNRDGSFSHKGRGHPAYH